MTWVIEPEFVACAILLILLVYSFLDHGDISYRKQRMFRNALVVSLISIFINIASTAGLRHPDMVPESMNRLLCTLYFLMTPLMASYLCAYTLTLVYENKPNARGYRRAVVIITGVYVATVLITMSNGYTGWLFTLDAAGSYARGPLNLIGFGTLLADTAVVLVCGARVPAREGRPFRRTVYMAVPVAVLLAVSEALMPHMMLTGTAAALVLMIFFINGQQQSAGTDQLTDLGNRETLYRLVSEYAGRQEPFHVIAVSLRDYKTINVRYGQRGGDAYLHEIGKYLRELGRGVVACRFSGVQFAIIVPAMRDAEYESFFQSIVRRFSEQWYIEEYGDATFGACFADIAYPEHAADVDELVSSLEYAVRLAKSSGDRMPVRFQKQIKAALGRRNYVLSLLEPALKNDRFYLNYQPIYDCQQDRLVGAEVLLRLREEDGRPVPPNEFIPLAEEAGLIGELSWIVLDKSCRFLAEHRDIGIEWLSVNISAAQFESRELVWRVFDTLEKYDLQPYALKLEITERVLVEDVAQARSILKELNDGGVGVCLDDFGTGYSNLANVSSLPFECVKVDKSFIDDVVEDERAFTLLENVVQGLRFMDVEVLAEGVETEEQTKIVNMLSVDKIQGYYYSKPLEEALFVQRMIEQ